MEVNCLTGYLTSKCNGCPFWTNTEHAVGCGIPAPIERCPAFKEEVLDRGNG